MPQLFVPPEAVYKNALADYARGDYDLAISGFRGYITSFPKSDMADDAQVFIGKSDDLREAGHAWHCGEDG